MTDTNPTPIPAGSRRWKCPACGRETDVSYADVVDIGNPICCDGRDMELLPDLPARPRVRLIVDMFGGTIQGVYQDNPAVEIADMIFTEGAKYLDGEDDRDDEGELRFGVESGPLKGQGIYTHVGGIILAGPELFDPVFKAAQARIDFRQQEDSK